MNKKNFKHIKRLFFLAIICGVGVLCASNQNLFKRVKAEEDKIYNYDEVAGYVTNEYDSYVEENTAAHKDKYGETATLYPSSLKENINAENYYKGGTTIVFNEEYVVNKTIVSNGFLFKEINGVTTKREFDATVYEVIEMSSIDKAQGVSLDKIASKIVIIEEQNEDGTYTYYREDVELANMKDVKFDEMLLQQDEGMVTWRINVPQAGFYNLSLAYYPIEGNSSNIERSLAINGTVPFDGADTFSFSRIWQDRESSYEIDENGNRVLKTDVKGNDMKPKQVENPFTTVAYFKDDMGYVNEPYMFYLDEGINDITLLSVKEPVLIDQILVTEVYKNVSYKEYLASFGQNVTSTSGKSVRIEAENTFTKSSPTLYPSTDRSSSKTYPFSYTTTKLNVIGGTNWQVLGDWITWQFEVPETGFYNISMRAKQNMVRGMYSSRKVYINDQILFDELNDVQFKYKNNWQIVTLGNAEEDFLFYFEAGQTYTIKMEVTLGQYAPLIEDLQVCIDDLSKIYRMIIAHTTVTPEAGTDYLLEKNFPTLKADLKRNLDELTRISNEISNISGGKSDKTGVIDNVTIQLKDFVKNVEIIPDRLSTFSSNVSSLGTLLNSLRELPLQLDYLQIHSADVNLGKANENIFRKAWDSVVSFVLSFFLDYSSISQTEKTEIEGEVVNIDVWMTLGRDQANVIRSLIDTSFAKEHPNIQVELKLTAGDVLLKATLAGIGPDVALNVDSSLPVNYALRNAVMDLSERIYEYEYDIEVNEDGEYVLTSAKLPKLSENYKTDVFGNKTIQAAYTLAEDMIVPSGSKLPTLANLQMFINDIYPTYFDALRDELKASAQTAGLTKTDEEIEKDLVARLKAGVEIKAGMSIPTYIYELYPELFTVLRNVDNSKMESKLIKDQDFLLLNQGTDFNFWENTDSYAYAKNIYMESSLRQFQFQYDFDESNGNKYGYGTYSLPEKQIFLMMFVRDDIMDELGLTDMIPETWNDMIDLIAELQTSQLQFYLPVNSEGASALNPIFISKLYQHGGSIYASDNKSTGFKSDAAMTAFEEWTEYYTLYSFPLAANFTNRFRSGEQPIGISYYELYNTLSVFAPELNGRWSFHKIPGTERTLDVVDDEGNPTGDTVTYVDHTAVASGTCCVMMRQPGRLSDEEAQKAMDASWEFMKWWSSAETQTSFGREMEGILGSAARHTTANVKALQQLAWKKSDLNVLMNQWSEVREIPQIAGSYITGREIENAYRQVINNGYNPREVLYEYAGKIDVEIDRKRTEFGLELDE